MADQSSPLIDQLLLQKAAARVPAPIAPTVQPPAAIPPPEVQGQQPLSLPASMANQPLTPQPQLKPPGPTAGYGMPALISMIGQMIHPTGTVQPGQLPRAPSRLDAFEHFLGNFASSLASGMAASGTGPGANIRGAAAALGEPHQALVQNYQMQQQARQLESEQAVRAAQTQQVQAETQAIPQRLEYEHQVAIANLGLKKAQEEFNNLYKQQMLNLNSGKFDLAKQKQSFDQANVKWEQQYKAAYLDAQKGNIQSQIQFRADSMNERRYMDSQVTSLRQQANDLRAQGLTQQADSLDLQAANITNRIGLMATIESGLGMRTIVQPTRPVVQPPKKNAPPAGGKGKVLVEGKDF